MYTRRLPSDLQEIDRDVFNEKPSKEDIIAVPEGQGLFTGSAFVACLSRNFLVQFKMFSLSLYVISKTIHV